MVWLAVPRRQRDPQQSSIRRSSGRVDRALTLVEAGPFFLGSEVMLVDCVYVPFLERMSASLLYYKGLRIKGRGSPWPNITRWFEALEVRPSYQGIRSDFHTHSHDLPPQLGGCHRNGTPEQIAAARKLDSWTLPLGPLTGDSLEPMRHDYAERPALDRQEAAIAVVRHKDSLLRSALLAINKKNDRAQESNSLDAALRVLCSVMLVPEANGTKEKDSTLEALQTAFEESSLGMAGNSATVARSLRHIAIV